MGIARKRVAVAVLIVASLFAACGGGRSASDVTGSAVPMKRLKIGIGPFLVNVPTHIAKSKGLFEKQGLDVQFVQFQQSSKGLPALASGEIDAMIGSAAPALINAIAKGLTVKAVGDEGRVDGDACRRHSIVASPRVLASGAVRGLADLKGRKLAYGEFSLDAYMVHKALQSVGLDVDDVTAVDVPDEVLPSALGKGDLDFAVLAEPDLTQVVSTGKARDWHPVSRYVDGLQTSMVLFGPTLLKDKETGRKLLVANNEGIRIAKEGKTAENVAAAAEFSGLDAAVVNKTCWPTYGDDGRVDWSSIDEMQKWFFARKLIDKTVTEDQLWTDEFLPAR